MLCVVLVPVSAVAGGADALPPRMEYISSCLDKGFESSAAGVEEGVPAEPVPRIFVNSS